MKRLVGFLVMGIYVVNYMLYRMVLALAAVLYRLLKYFKITMWGVLPIILFFCKVGIGLVVLFVLVACLIV